MKKVLAASLLAIGLALGTAQAQDAATAAAAHPQIGAHVTFLYYKDVNAAARFYEDSMGLKKTYDQGWVKMYEIVPGSQVGLVDETKGYHKAPATTPAVMVSIETTDLEGWYRRLKDKGAPFLKELDPNGKHPLVNSILLKDPGGYTVEFFRWKKLRAGSSRFGTQRGVT